MCAIWNDKYEPEIAIKRINDIRLENGDDSKSFLKLTHKRYPEVEFDGIPFDEYFLLLLSTISFQSEIPRRQYSSLLKSAIFETAQKGLLTKEKLINELTNLEIDFFKRPIKRYKFIDCISFIHTDKINRRKINDVTIAFSPNNQEILDTEVGRDFNSFFSYKYPLSYTTVNLFVDAKSIDEAKDVTNLSLNILRGIWNFIVNRTKWPLIPESIIKPINSFLPGPITVGKEISASKFTWWYEVDYPGNYKPTDLTKALDKFLIVEKEVRNKLTKSNFKSDLELCFAKYATALDEKDPKKSFIKLWSLLETLTNTANDSYSTTIKRTAFLYHDYKYHKLILEQLRSFRNDIVHNDTDSEHSKYHVYQLKRYVERLILFFLNGGQNFDSIHEISHVLSLSRNTSDLQYQIELRQKALEIRE